jgi:hypothetical protein
VITAAVTAAIAAILGFFGIKPGPYLVVVAIVVKGLIIAAGVLFGARWMQRRRKPEPPAPPPT